MIILIGGASHTGKTLLAQRLLEQYRWPYLSIDHLKMGLIRSGQTDLTPMDDDRLTAYLWLIVREMVKTAIENGQNLIVEGCYIPFDWAAGFEESYRRQIRCVFLVMSRRYITEHFAEKFAVEPSQIFAAVGIIVFGYQRKNQQCSENDPAYPLPPGQQQRCCDHPQ